MLADRALLPQVFNPVRHATIGATVGAVAATIQNVLFHERHQGGPAVFL
jgi:hypothetical protein